MGVRWSGVTEEGSNQIIYVVRFLTGNVVDLVLSCPKVERSWLDNAVFKSSLNASVVWFF